MQAPHAFGPTWGRSSSRGNLKGLFHGMNIFLRAYEVKPVLSVYSLMSFKFFWCFIAEKIKYYVYLLLWKCFLILKIPFKGPNCGIQNLPDTVKLAQKPGCDSENCSENRQWHVHLRRFFLCPMSVDFWRKLTNDRDTKPKRKSDAAVGTSLRIRKCCWHRSKQNLCIKNFLRQGNLKIWRMYRKYTNIIFIHLVTQYL